jgi:hypothetical protein
LIKKQLHNDARRYRHEHIVSAYLHPMMAVRRPAQAMRAPVVHDILMAAVLRRHVAAVAQMMVRDVMGTPPLCGAQSCPQSCRLKTCWAIVMQS